jgi:glucose-1-phosphate thymidylyltransferase
MKAIIPCAGRGKRLRPLTFTNSKPLIPIANKPLVHYAIEKLRDVGITEIGIIVGENTRDMEDVINDGSELGVHITYIHQENPLGIAHTIMVAKDFLGDSPFVMYLGDNLMQESLDQAVQQFKSNGSNAMLFLCPTDKPQLYGIAVVEDDRIVRLIEKPQDPPSNLACIGIYLFDSTIHSITDNMQPSPRGEYEITDAIQGLLDNGGHIEHHILNGWWIDAGNPDDMIEANRLVLQGLQEPDIQGAVDAESDIRGNVIIGKGSRIERSTIRGPVIIGEDCLIRAAFVGSFSSIGDRTEIVNSEVEYSVIMQDCEITDIEQRIDNSIFGRNVRIVHTQRRPRSHKLILSDNSAGELG